MAFSSFNSIHSVTTQGGKMIVNPPTGLTVQSLTDTLATISFTPPAGTVTSYLATLNTGATFTSTSSPISITGLTPGTSYTISIQSIKSGVYSIPSSSLNITTLLYYMYPPANLTADSSTLSALSYGNGTYTASASNDRNGSGARSAFNTGNFWQVTYTTNGSTTSVPSVFTTVSGTSYQGDWVQIRLPNSILVKRYSIIGQGANNPTGWVIAGSTNGTTWTSLDNKTSQSVYLGPTFTYDFTNSTQYNYYRFIYLTSSGIYPVLSGLKFYSTTSV